MGLTAPFHGELQVAHRRRRRRVSSNRGEAAVELHRRARLYYHFSPRRLARGGTLELIGNYLSPFVRRVAVSLNALEIPSISSLSVSLRSQRRCARTTLWFASRHCCWRTAMCWSKATPSWMRSTGWSAPSGPHTGIRQAEAQGDEDDGDCPGLDREGAVGLLRTPIPAVGESASAVDRAQRRPGDRRVGVP